MNSALTERGTIEQLKKKERYLAVIYQFATSLLEARTIDEVVWTVAKNAIAQLGYLDCVIYLFDKESNCLVQRAAHGPKNPIALDILNPIRLKIGEGVVGDVAKRKKGEIVSDTSKDPRYVIDDDMRLSEIAVPIIHNNSVIGVIDSEHPDRNFYPAEDLQILETIASMTATKLEQTRNNEELIQLQLHLQQLVKERTQEVEQALAEVHRQKSEITDSIHYAKRIQSAILPADRILKENLKQLFIFYKPKDIVAGDFYWTERVDDIVYFAVADCTGHGVPGAMVSVVCHNALNSALKEFKLRKPSAILNKVRELVIETFEKSDEDVTDGMDIGLCAFNSKEMKLAYAGANIPLYIVRDSKLNMIKADKQPIGKHSESRAFTQHEIAIQKNDMIYMLSDGFADQFGGEKGKKFRTSKLKELLLEISSSSVSQQRKQMEKCFSKWKGDLDQVDDVTVVGVRV
jgi:serine phosphatase RsbU (regulator of sigma subunit)